MASGSHSVQVLLLLAVLAAAVFGNVAPAPVGAVTPNPPPGGVTWAASENISGGSDAAYGVAVDASGVYVVGSDSTPGNLEWRVEKRSLTNGAITWGVSENISGGDDEALGVAVDASGVYVVGYDRTPSNWEWRVEKRSPTTGAIMWAVSEDISSGTDYAFGVAVDASGVYVVGYDFTPGNSEWRVEKRSLTTGTLMWGVSENISSGTDEAHGVAVDGLGVYVVGWDRNTVGSNAEWRVEKRSLTTGAIVWAASEHISSLNDAAYGVAVDVSGVYVVGYDYTPSNWEWRIEKRSLATGAIMWATSENISSGNDRAWSVAVDGSGVYVGGFDSTPGNEELRVEKRSLTTGATIWAASENVSSGNDEANGVGVDGSGVYAAGYDSTPGNNEWRVERRSKPQADALSATGMGSVAFTANNGSLLSLTAKSASSVSPLPPAGLTFPYGLFNFTVGNLTAGGSVNVTATLPTPLPKGPALMYWTFHNGVWRQLSASHLAVYTNRTMFNVTLTDGVASDDKDETENSLIVDFGGVAYAYNVTLVAGWNLISLPVVPVDPTATNMMKSLAASGKLVSVYGYTGTPRTWKYYLPGKASTLTTINDGNGYWVYMRSADTLYVNGTVIPPASTPPAYALVAGWNLVGFKGQPNATEPKQVSQFLTSISGSYDVDEVWLYDSSSHVWAQMGASDTLHPGDAFWVRMTAAATLYPE